MSRISPLSSSISSCFLHWELKMIMKLLLSCCCFFCMFEVSSPFMTSAQWIHIKTAVITIHPSSYKFFCCVAGAAAFQRSPPLFSHLLPLQTFPAQPRDVSGVSWGLDLDMPRTPQPGVPRHVPIASFSSWWSDWQGPCPWPLLDIYFTQWLWCLLQVLGLLFGLCLAGAMG